MEWQEFYTQVKLSNNYYAKKINYTDSYEFTTVHMPEWLTGRLAKPLGFALKSSNLFVDVKKSITWILTNSYN